jgi:hypothetical protein
MRKSVKLVLASIPLLLIPYAAAHAAPMQWSVNGHWYEAVSVPNGITWDQANAAASTSVFMGMTGHLATITSAGENLFISGLSPNPGAGVFILGGFQSPLATTMDGGWNWVTGEPFVYTNWNPFGAQEPNDGNDGSEALGPGDEDKLHFRGDFFVNADGLTWNDYDGGSSPLGYVVEFEPQQIGVPEPETYALMLTALGLLGLLARRKNKLPHRAAA